MKLDTPSKKPSAGCCRFGIFLVSSVVGKTNKKLCESGRNLIRVCLDSWLCYLLTQLPGKKINLENSQLLAQCFFGGCSTKGCRTNGLGFGRKNNQESGSICTLILWRQHHPMDDAGTRPWLPCWGPDKLRRNFGDKVHLSSFFFSFKTANSRLYGQSRGCYTSRQTHSRREVSFSFIHMSSSERLK